MGLGVALGRERRASERGESERRGGEAGRKEGQAVKSVTIRVPGCL